MNGIDGATYTDTHIFYEFSFDLRKIEKAKQIGMVFSKAKKRWYLSRNMMNERLFEIQFSKDPVVQVRHHVMLEAAGHYKPNPLLMEHQRRAVELAMNTDRHLFAYDTGCHARGTKILMADGRLKNVEDIKIGDQLIGPKGDTKTVLKLYYGREEMFEVRPNKGESFIVNGSHILPLQQYHRTEYLLYQRFIWNNTYGCQFWFR